MKWEWRAAWRQVPELMFGATVERRHHLQRHKDLHKAYELFMEDTEESVSGRTADVGTGRGRDGQLSRSAAVLRHRDHGYFDVRKHFERIPRILSDLEFYFALTGLGLFDYLIGVLLLPLKVLMQGRHCELRDGITLLVLSVCLASYWVGGLATTQLYSYLYHAVRRTSFIKLVMIFGILDVADKILSSFSQDSLEVLYACLDDEKVYRRHRNLAAAAEEKRKQNNTPAPPGPAARTTSDFTASRSSNSKTPADGLRDSAAQRIRGGDAEYYGEVSPTSEDHAHFPARQILQPSRWLLVGSAVAACASTSLHSLCLLLHVVTLNVAINAEGNSLVALLIGNNFSELKSVVFKKNTAESLHAVCAIDALERMQYVVFFLVMLLHHMHERFSDFALADVCIILGVEVAIDFIKHLFVSKFNGIPPSVFRSFSQLSLLDLSCETVLWRLPEVAVVTTDNAGREQQLHDAAELLTPSCGFAPKNVKRAGFDAIAYAALLLWSCARVGGYVLLHAPLIAGLLVVVLVLLKLMLSSVVYGVCSRFTLRTLVVVPPQWPAPTAAVKHGGGGGGAGLPRRTTSLSGQSRRCSESVSNLAPSSWGVRLGVSPIGTPCATPLHAIGHPPLPAGVAAAAATATASFPPSSGTRTIIRLTPILLALLKVDRFDLQAGKAKRVY